MSVMVVKVFPLPSMDDIRFTGKLFYVIRSTTRLLSTTAGVYSAVSR